MEEQELDVNATEPSAVEQESSNEVQEVAQPETKEVVETPKVETAPEVRKPLVDEVDEMGVPLKNRLAEAQRKLQQREKELEEARSAKQQQPEQPKYTKAQLTAFAAAQDTDPQSRAWALDQLDKISNVEMENAIAKKFEEVTKVNTEGQIRQQTFQSVLQRNPDLAVKDPAGNFLGFNTQSPLYQRMNFYMQNPKIIAEPAGMEIAEALAIRDLHYAQKPVVAKTIEKQANQIKSLQKKTMVEGSGNNSNVQVSSRQVALEKVKQTGKVADAAVAMGQILRAGGIMSDE